MPIYVYQCSACEARVEEIQKMSDPPPPKCEKCGKTGTLKKQMGKSNFELKGGGWAADGYSSST
jgi:putative FmdB family regulatory protein